MPKPVLIRGSLRVWDHATVLVAGLIVMLVGGGLAVGLGKITVALLLGALGLFLVVAAIICHTWRVHRRRWVVDEGDGFLIRDRAGERRYADADILAMAMSRTNNYSQGILKSETRRLQFWLDDRGSKPEAVEMTNTMKIGATDPLGSFIQRIGDLLFTRAKQELAAGQAVLGEHWELDEKALTVRDGKHEITCPVAEVSAFDIVDGKISVWRTGQDEPIARVPAKSANAFILQRLLAERLSSRPAPDVPVGSGLGRLIFERRPQKGTVFVGAVCAVAFVIGVPVILILVPGIGRFVWALGSAGLAVAAILGTLHARRATFRCHENGVYKTGLLGETTLRYSEVESFSYGAVRNFHNGAYQGTSFHFVFTPHPDHGAKRIRYGVSRSHADQEMERLRDDISKLIAQRMKRRFDTDEEVRWTSRLWFLADGIEFHPKGFFGPKGEIFVPFRDIASYRIDQGTFSLWVRNRKKPIIREPMTASNFFPGFYLLSELVPLGYPGDEADARR